ncbi:DUF6607 family protein [Gilvibacter sp.]|uniref:DUF6607 family protein n=1 Tax=Gilvibacter sp. TaxID=2729997 RepID=UPI0025C0D2B8|nr:DUF6607 family protein [Gilvibacter sp.]NQX76638.1 hypothetical protein [Gilvibacter sp.]
MKTNIILFFTLIIALPLSAQSKKKQDIAAIKSMCGCYEVTFNFAETFTYSEDSLYKPSKNKVSYGLEWAQLVSEDKNNVSIQHILQVGNPSEPMIVKHWRQDWSFQNQDFYMYDGDNNWIYQRKDKADVKGQWTQKVFQVDDSPRYEGSASWVHVDGKSYWENTTPAPLPRREYTTRSDYNVTIRGNRQEITNFGWVHDQDNQKVIRTPGEDDIILAAEKGYNVYKKVDDSRCAAAAKWWVENNEKWATVRAKWDEVYARNMNLSLETKVDNKRLYSHLFTEDELTQNDIDTIIESFVKKP